MFKSALYDDCAEAYIEFKNKQNPIQEALKPHHIDKADGWNHFNSVDEDTKNKVEKALGDRNGYGKTIVPLEHADVPEDPDVVGHLANHGWKIHSYLDGIAHTTKMVGNPEKGIPMQEKTIKSTIGKVLSATHAPEHIKNAFANDPVRSIAKSTTNDLRVMISTHPHSIGGMSTGTTWQSCMNMDNGCNRDYLPSESMSGTHVAFLVHKDDKGANEGTVPTAPLARIALKPFHNDFVGKRDTIFRPENKMYGNAGTAFEDTVSRWAKNNYPAKTGVSYDKNASSYDDSGNNKFISLGKEDVFKKLDDDRSVTNHNTEIDNDAVSHAVNYHKERNLSHREYADYIDNIKYLPLRASHVAELFGHIPKVDESTEAGTKERNLDQNSNSMQLLATHHGDKFTSKHISEYRDSVNTGKFPSLDSTLATKVLSNPRLPDHIVDNIQPHHFFKLHPSKIGDSQVGKLIDAVKTADQEDISLRWQDLKSNVDKFKEHHLKEVLGLPGLEKQVSIFQPFLDNKTSSDEPKQELTNMFVHSSGGFGRRVRMKSQFITPEHIKNFSNTTNEFGETHTSNEKLLDVFGNRNISDETKFAVKNKYMEIPKEEKQYLHLNRVPSNISEKFTDSDIDKLTNEHVAMPNTRDHLWGNKELHNRLLDNLEHKIDTAHSTSLEMAKVGKTETPEFSALGKHTKRLVKCHGTLLFDHINRHLNPDMSEDAEINEFDDGDATKQLNRFAKIKQVIKHSPHPEISEIAKFGGNSDHQDGERGLQYTIDDVDYHRREMLTGN